MKQDRPNILLIMTDQQRYDSLGCYGGRGVHTPRLDRLAEEGVLFEHCYINNPLCTPSRASLHTGKHLPGHGVYRLYDNLPGDEVLFTKRLKECGYQTALFGKLHVSSRMYEAEKRHPHDGFDIYEWCHDPCLHLDSPHNGYVRWLKENAPGFYRKLKDEGRNIKNVPREVHMTHWAAERTIDFIKNASQNQPFFVEMSVFDPHSPYDDHPEKFRELVADTKISGPIFDTGEMEKKPEGVRRECGLQTLDPLENSDWEKIKEMRIGYHASVALIDLEVGRVLDALESRGIAGETLVIFTSDHGDMLGDHRLFTKGAFFYDPCTRVPLLMKWPERIRSEIRIAPLVQTHDLAATILSAAGYPEEKLAGSMPDSHNLLPLACGRREKVHDYVICCYRNSGITAGTYHDPEIHATMIRDQRFKLNLYHGLDRSRSAEGELFDMDNDPEERNDLWDNPEHAGVKMELLARLVDWSTGQELKRGSRGGESLPPQKDG